MSTIHITLTLKIETLEKLDAYRGLAKRSTVIESIISEFFNKNMRKK